MGRTRRATQIRNPQLGISPEGTLLDYIGDLSGDFGFAYERFLNFEKGPHSHDRFVFCAARGPTSFQVTEIKTGKIFINSKETTVFKAPNSPHQLKSFQTIYENLVFLPSVERVRAVFTERGYNEKQWRLLTTGIRELKRSPWFDALVERYFSRRIFAPGDQSSLRFMEEEILREILSLALGESTWIRPRQTASSLDSLSSSIRNGIEAIELSLFSKIDLAEIAKAAGMSRASLMRSFQRELKISPMAYVRHRRLEEAKRLLKKKTHTIAEVSCLVGYDDVSAFCRAYKAHFGSTPRTSENESLPLDRVISNRNATDPLRRTRPLS